MTIINAPKCAECAILFESMKISEFNFREGNHFVAMEYYWLVMNRTFLVILVDGFMIGLKANGLIGATSAGDPATNIITHVLANNGDLTNPYSYVNSRYISEAAKDNLFGEEILKLHRSNFRITRKDITDVEYRSGKKWGMGNYPHDGTVTISTRDNRKREFIILGNQSGENIRQWILNNKTIL
jgi:hypothetical protein